MFNKFHLYDAADFVNYFPEILFRDLRNVFNFRTAYFKRCGRYLQGSFTVSFDDTCRSFIPKFMNILYAPWKLSWVTYTRLKKGFGHARKKKINFKLTLLENYWNFLYVCFTVFFNNASCFFMEKFAGISSLLFGYLWKAHYE